MTGFTLPGMMELPGCTSGNVSSPIPALGPRAQKADVVGYLVEADGDASEHAAGQHHAVEGALGLKVVVGLQARQHLRFPKGRHTHGGRTRGGY